MRLALQTDYALRTLMYLAARAERVTIREVAGFYGISAAHVAKVANQLARFGLVRGVRGIGGGIELGQPAAEIRIGQVVQAFEGGFHLLDCIPIENVCAIQSFCKLRGVLAEAERRQQQYLDSVTLADVVPTRRQVARRPALA